MNCTDYKYHLFLRVFCFTRSRLKLPIIIMSLIPVSCARSIDVSMSERTDTLELGGL